MKHGEALCRHKLQKKLITRIFDIQIANSTVYTLAQITNISRCERKLTAVHYIYSFRNGIIFKSVIWIACCHRFMCSIAHLARFVASGAAHKQNSEPILFVSWRFGEPVYCKHEMQTNHTYVSIKRPYTARGFCSWPQIAGLLIFHTHHKYAKKSNHD